MRKAFLCHSSLDKPFVEKVAQELGRAKVAFDAFLFEANDDLRLAIRKGIEISGVFIFFASKASLSSCWCQYELDEANNSLVHQSLTHAITIAIDPVIEIQELPYWLRRSRVLSYNSPHLAALEIHHSLLAAESYVAPRIFVGRQQLLADFVHKIAPDTLETPNILVVAGLENIGRRSYLQKAIVENLGLKLGPFISVDETRTLEDVYLQLLDRSSPPGIILSDECKAFSALSTDAQTSSIVDMLQTIAAQRFVPCFIDNRGMLRDDGAYRPEYPGQSHVGNGLHRHDCASVLKNKWGGCRFFLALLVDGLTRHRHL